MLQGWPRSQRTDSAFRSTQSRIYKVREFATIPLAFVKRADSCFGYSLRRTTPGPQTTRRDNPEHRLCFAIFIPLHATAVLLEVFPIRFRCSARHRGALFPRGSQCLRSNLSRTGYTCSQGCVLQGWLHALFRSSATGARDSSRAQAGLPDSDQPRCESA